MASKIYKFYGKSKWCKHQKPDEKYKNYSIDLFMDQDSWDLFRKSGLQLKVREAEEGKFVSFKRAHSKLIKNDVVEFGPPEVECDFVGFNGNIGNGSEVRIDVVVYDTMKGKGHRLDKIKVIELVPYGDIEVEDAHAEDDEEDEPKPEAKRFGKQAQQMKLPAIDDDEIPF